MASAAIFGLNSLLSWIDIIGFGFIAVGFWNIATCWTAGKIESKLGGAASNAFDDWLTRKGEKKADEAEELVGEAGKAAEKGDTKTSQEDMNKASKKLQESIDNYKKEIEDLNKQIASLKQKDLQPEEAAKVREAEVNVARAQQKNSNQEKNAAWSKAAAPVVAKNPQRLLPTHIKQFNASVEASKPGEELKKARRALVDVLKKNLEKKQKAGSIIHEIEEIDTVINKEIKTLEAASKVGFQGTDAIKKIVRNLRRPLRYEYIWMNRLKRILKENPNLASDDLKNKMSIWHGNLLRILSPRTGLLHDVLEKKNKVTADRLIAESLQSAKGLAAALQQIKQNFTRK